MKALCGFSQRKITPEAYKVYLDGYGHRLGPAKSVRDDLYVKICAFVDEQNNRFAIVSFDICGFSEETADILKYHISYINGLSNEGFAICATHTHAGPACGILAELPINYDYWHYVGSEAGNCVKKAFEAAEQGELSISFGKDIVSSYNRRRRDINDKRVRVCGFFDRDNNLKGVLTRATCHAVIETGDIISADFPSVLTKEFGSTTALFLQGSCGDIDPYFEGKLTAGERIEKLGHELYESVKDAYDSAAHGHTEGKFILKHRYEKIRVPMQEYPDRTYLEKVIDETTKEYYGTEEAVSKHITLRKLDWYRSILKEVEAGKETDINVPVQVLILSDGNENAVFVFLPFEVLCGTSYKIERKLIQKGFKAENIFVTGYSNSVFGYLIPKEELEYGGYEASSAPMWYNMPMFSEKSEDTVIENVMRLIQF